MVRLDPTPGSASKRAPEPQQHLSVLNKVSFEPGPERDSVRLERGTVTDLCVSVWGWEGARIVLTKTVKN